MRKVSLNNQIKKDQGYCVAFEVSGDSLELLRLSTQCLFKSSLHTKPSYYAIITASDLSEVLLLSNKITTYRDNTLTKLPYGLNTEDMFYNFVKDWLLSTNKGQYYDEDGYPGFTIKLTDTNIWDGIIVIEREEFINGK